MSTWLKLAQQKKHELGLGSEQVLKLIDRAEGSSVRGMIGPDGMQVFSVYDFLTVACGYSNSGASARNEFKRLTKHDSEFKNEIVASCYNLRFPGQRGSGTPCMSIRRLQRLLMIQGGKVAAEFREIVEGTFTRVMAGAASDAIYQKMLYRAYGAHHVCLRNKHDRLSNRLI